jgi:hypothetical protein
VLERKREAADRRGDIGSGRLGGRKANQVFHWSKLYQAGLLGTVNFSTNAEFDAVSHLIGTTVGWGGNPPYAAIYQSVFPKQNDGKTMYALTVKDVPVDGFWSISVYNAKGYFRKTISTPTRLAM